MRGKLLQPYLSLLKEVNFGETLANQRMGVAARGTSHVIGELGISEPPPDLQGGERDWRLN